MSKGEIVATVCHRASGDVVYSSGTSGGKQKIFPVNDKYFKNMSFINGLCSSILSKYIDGVRKGKVMTFLNTRPLSTTPSGLPIAPLSTSFLMSDYFKNLPSKCYSDQQPPPVCQFLTRLRAF
ncbi:predicted protein [Arabidopsis lyrata subsp. lyrata]|uniref:Predicted protein n=1 Tax=Arabidopsis lyrata subsp. lyrata TaxID=81972 RepID=D7KD46_ARALL|nr:predicted protein [Arabidopsis lyrata subsp. lyrata]